MSRIEAAGRLVASLTVPPMSEAAAAQEPTMEEILASIRRIISEDEAPAAAEAAPEPEEPAPIAAAPEPEPPPPPAPVAKDEVLELTQRVEPEPPPPAPAPEPASSLGDLDFSDADVAPMAAPAPPPAPRKVETLVSDHAATAAAGHFGALGQALLMPSTGRTLEDVVKELMKPMLKAWLDENLPSITEAAVRGEVERISRRGH